MPARFLETRELPLDELTPFPGNARRGQVEIIRESLRRNGQYRSMVVRVMPHTGAWVVLAGNHTLQAMIAEGHKTGRCELIECSDDEARRVNLVDNQASDLAVNDTEALLELLGSLDDGLEGTGFTDADMEALLAAPPAAEPGAESDQPRLDEKSPVTCPECGHEFVPG